MLQRPSRWLAAVMFGISVASVAQQRQGAELPEGEGKAFAEAVCSTCHRVDYIGRSSGYTASNWRELIASMIELAQTPEREKLVAYLAAHFPPHTNRAPTLVPGPISISFQEWVTPTRGQRSRDPVEAPDGSIWWAGQWGNLVGRTDPVTGEMKEFVLPANSMPHTVTPDQHGAIWYNESRMRPDTLVRFEPKTQRFQSWPIPSGDLYAGIARHIRATRDGRILIEQTATGRIIEVTIQKLKADRVYALLRRASKSVTGRSGPKATIVRKKKPS